MQRKFTLALLPTLLFFISNAQQRLLDQPVTLKYCIINIAANEWYATTVMELEFYNDRLIEVEALQEIQLAPNQVITNFELMLDGKYREGSIEEHWKATNAYRSIVGKRIDPAIISMLSRERYRLNIYPIAPKSSRKVRITIDQLMSRGTETVSYTLPLVFGRALAKLNLTINYNEKQAPFNPSSGIVAGSVFAKRYFHQLQFAHDSIMLNQPVLFSAPVRSQHINFCKPGDVGKSFLSLFDHGVSTFSYYKANNVTVYWDVSASAKNRDVEKEVNFLAQYFKRNQTGKAVFYLFNNKIVDSFQLNDPALQFNAVKHYLKNFITVKTTNYDCLRFNHSETDAYFVFTDGFQSYRTPIKHKPVKPVFPVTTASQVHFRFLYSLASNTGGRIVALSSDNWEVDARRADSVENFMTHKTGSFQKYQFEQPEEQQLSSQTFIEGIATGDDQINLKLGNRLTSGKIIRIPIIFSQHCDSLVYDKIKMLLQYEKVIQGGGWNDMIVFGINRRVVTYQTSFLVLERIEDYIRYQIAPPKELEAKCAEMNYVYKSQYKIESMQQFYSSSSLTDVVTSYNNRIRWWDARANVIDLSAPVATSVVQSNDNSGLLVANNTNISKRPLEGGSKSLSEVVVTGYFRPRQNRNLSYASSMIRQAELSQTDPVNFSEGLSGKTSGIMVQGAGRDFPLGGFATIRGMRTFTGNSSPLIIVDNMPMDAVFFRSMNPNEIKDVAILKSLDATAVYGSLGANGAIVITTKKKNSKYQPWGEHNIEGMDDVEYVYALRNAESRDLLATYESLEQQERGNAMFKADAATVLFNRGFKADAIGILEEIVEENHIHSNTLMLVAFLFEEWREYDLAIAVYERTLYQFGEHAITLRNLALCYYQQGEYQRAVDTYYKIISAGTDRSYAATVKEIALNEMNAVIAAHGESVNVSRINPHLIKPLPVDLYITVQNFNSCGHADVVEPGNKETSHDKTITAKRGYVQRYGYSWYNGESMVNYTIRNAKNGKYRIKIPVYHPDYYDNQSVTMARVVVFKNFQQAKQKLEINNVVLNNLYGRVQIATVKW